MCGGVCNCQCLWWYSREQVAPAHVIIPARERWLTLSQDVIESTFIQTLLHVHMMCIV